MAAAQLDLALSRSHHNLLSLIGHKKSGEKGWSMSPVYFCFENNIANLQVDVKTIPTGFSRFYDHAKRPPLIILYLYCATKAKIAVQDYL